MKFNYLSGMFGGGGGNKIGTIDQQFEVNQCRNKDNIMVNSITFMQAYKDKVGDLKK